MINERWYADMQVREMQNPRRWIRAQMRREAELLRSLDRQAARRRKLWLPFDLRTRKASSEHIAWV